MFISPAFAQAAAAPGDSSNFFLQMAPLILIFVVFYFLLIRPQQKKVKEHRTMLDAIRRGDRIVTNGGIIGLVKKVNDEARELEVEIAENVRVKVVRDMVASVLSRTEPAEKAEVKEVPKT